MSNEYNSSSTTPSKDFSPNYYSDPFQYYLHEPLTLNQEDPLKI